MHYSSLLDLVCWQLGSHYAAARINYHSTAETQEFREGRSYTVDGCFFESLWRRYFHKQLSGARDIDATNETIASGHRKQCEYSLQTSK